MRLAVFIVLLVEFRQQDRLALALRLTRGGEFVAVGTNGRDLVFRTAVAFCHAAQLVHRAALCDDDKRLFLDILHGRIAEIHVFNVQHLARNIPRDRHGTPLVGILTGADALVPVGV